MYLRHSVRWRDNVSDFCDFALFIIHTTGHCRYSIYLAIFGIVLIVYRTGVDFAKRIAAIKVKFVEWKNRLKSVAYI